MNQTDRRLGIVGYSGQLLVPGQWSEIPDRVRGQEIPADRHRSASLRFRIPQSFGLGRCRSGIPDRLRDQEIPPYVKRSS